MYWFVCLYVFVYEYLNLKSTLTINSILFYFILLVLNPLIKNTCICIYIYVGLICIFVYIKNGLRIKQEVRIKKRKIEE